MMKSLKVFCVALSPTLQSRCAPLYLFGYGVRLWRLSARLCCSAQDEIRRYNHTSHGMLIFCHTASRHRSLARILEADDRAAYIQRKMAALFQRMFRRNSPRLPAIDAGQRIYAIGDVHGRLDLLTVLCQAIEADDRQRGSKNTAIIFLGDLIDRGPDSAGVVQWTRAWSRSRKVRFISGNHEEMFLLSFHHAAALHGFLRYGGRETLASYGLDPDEIADMPFERAQETLVRSIPPQDRTFIDGFETTISIGDYLFVHAGIRPKVALDEQSDQDCRWIREPFLSHRGDHGKHIVHGHTISDEVDFRDNRSGIDTGAFRTGKLTALCLEGSERRILQTQQDEGGIRVVTGVAG